MKKLIILSFILLSLNCYSQSYQEQFLQICENGKLTQSKSFFLEWEKAEPNNPEMFVGLFNYHYRLSKSKMGEPNFLGGYLISDKDSINIKEIDNVFKESDSLFQISQNYLNKGISKNKDRLDMYLGRTSTLYEKGNKNDFIESLESIIKQNDINNGQWLWTNNESSHKNEEEFINIIQSFIYQIMTSNSPDYEQIITLSKLCLKTYPNNPILLSNIGYCKQEFGENKEAIEYFKKGLKAKPDDIILRFNIANAYAQIKQKDKAKEHYNFIIKNGNSEQTEIAKDLLNKLE